MAGLIEQAQGAAPQDDPTSGAGADPNAPAPADAGGSGQFNADDVKSQIQVPPELKEPFQRVITAGLKVMYDEQTHKLAMEQLNTPGPMGDKLGKAVAGLLATLIQQSNNTLPPQLIIPAGVYFIADAADFLEQTGKPIAPQDIGQATETMISELFKGAGMDPERMYQMLDQMGLSDGAEHSEGGAAPQDGDQGADTGAADDQGAGADDDPQAEAAEEDPQEEATETPDQEQAEDAQEEDADPQIAAQMQQRRNKNMRAKRNRKGT